MMIKIKDERFNHETGLYEFKLENDDTVLMTIREYEKEAIDNECYQVESVGEKNYYVELSEIEWSDEIPKIVGFSLV